jgi:hypothetical protein
VLQTTKSLRKEGPLWQNWKLTLAVSTHKEQREREERQRLDEGQTDEQEQLNSGARTGIASQRFGCRCSRTSLAKMPTARFP